MSRASIQRTRNELGPRARLQRAAVSRYLAAAAAADVLALYPSADALLQAFRSERAATLSRLLPMLTHRVRHGADRLPAELAASGALPADADPAPFRAPEYLERVAHLALELLLVHPAAPPLLVAPEPEPAALEALTQPLAAAVLFDYPLAVLHELYPLCTDAYVAALGGPDCGGGAVVGVHNDWLDGSCRARRAIVYCEELDVFVETDLPAPRALGPTLLLCQSPAGHTALSQRLQRHGVPHVNGAATATTADDKWACCEHFAAAGVATPPTLLLPAALSRNGCAQQVAAFVLQHQAPYGWFVQPRHGTEGGGVTWVSPGEAVLPGIALAWETLAAADDAILRPRVGTVCLQAPGGALPFDLRLQVFDDGLHVAAESGYLQVAPGAAEPIASTGRGGRIAPAAHLAQADLVAVGDPSRTLSWGAQDLARARDLSERAVRALGLRLAGVDLKFDVHEDRLTPTVLDVNPRPAGLLHANLLEGGEAGLGAGLWRLLAGLAR